MNKKIKIKDCSKCPCLYQNSEYPQSICKLSDKSWGMGHYEKGPAPDWCPLRKQNIELELR